MKNFVYFILSNILKNQGKTDIVLKLPMSLSIKALKTEVTVGIIMSSGKTFSFKDNPKIWSKGWLEDPNSL